MSACKAYLISLWAATMGADSRVWQPSSKFQHAQHAPMHAPVLHVYLDIWIYMGQFLQDGENEQ